MVAAGKSPAQATTETAGMIQSIQVETKNAVEAMELGNREVESGVKKTSASGAALEEIIKMAEDVGGTIAQIAMAATEPSSATEQINASVAKISSSEKYRKPVPTGFRSQDEGCRGWRRLGKGRNVLTLQPNSSCFQLVVHCLCAADCSLHVVADIFCSHQFFELLLVDEGGGLFAHATKNQGPIRCLQFAGDFLDCE
jgi:hypothetical protein